ncbi:MAG: redoxin domain-containing protein [Elusimicrobia bacterium]|nr:redoxin domain-containing protein [Elusimicrobiota bacterium]MDE2425125.1 redoxin domain-containing protein [Elusimicrobiota bacterium]
MTAANPASETTPIAVGSLAPDFTLPDQDKKEFVLSQFKGKKAVALFWYPLDWSPTCSKENACFTSDYSRFSRYAEVAAVSIDSTWSHKAWQEKMSLKHRLLSDMHRKVTKAYGLFLPAANISQRATVLIDKQGKVAWVKVQSDITKERDYNEIEEQLKKL